MNKIEGQIVLWFAMIVLHLDAFFTKFYLWRNKETRKALGLLDEMKGIDAIIYPNLKNKELRFGYLIRGTSIVLNPSSHKENKYDILVGIPEDPWEKPVKLEYILDNYPEKVKQYFLFNLTSFN